MNTTNCTLLLDATRSLIHQHQLQKLDDFDLLQEHRNLEIIQQQIDQTHHNEELRKQKIVNATELLSQTIIPKISLSKSNVNVKNLFMRYKALCEQYTNQLAVLNKCESIQKLPPKKLKPSAKNEYHLLDKYALHEKICQFTLEPSDFFNLINQLRKSNVLSPAFI